MPLSDEGPDLLLPVTLPQPNKTVIARNSAVIPAVEKCPVAYELIVLVRIVAVDDADELGTKRLWGFASVNTSYL